MVESRYYLAQHRTFPNLGLHFNDCSLTHRPSLHNGSNLYDDAILNQNSLSFVCSGLALEANGTPLTNNAIAAHSYGSVS